MVYVVRGCLCVHARRKEHWKRSVYVCVIIPDLLELPSEDLQVVEHSAHSQHHLCGVARGYADVPALRLLPFAH